MINMDRKIEQGRPFGLPETLVQSLAPRCWKSVMYRADSGGVFFLRTSRENKVFSLVGGSFILSNILMHL